MPLTASKKDQNLGLDCFKESHPPCSTNLRVVESRRMAVNAQTPFSSSSPKRRARRLRITAAIILVLGIFGADLVYWLESRSAVISNDPSLLGNEKEESRQAEILYGKQAGLIRAWTDDLKQPGTQAILIVVAAALVACGCIYFASLMDSRPENADESDLPHV
jgi:hypothetical protein